VLIGCEWNDLCAGIEHDAANPFFADCVCKCLQSACPPNVAAAFTSIPTTLPARSSTTMSTSWPEAVRQ
jgi:hypothetical protein